MTTLICIECDEIFAPQISGDADAGMCEDCMPDYIFGDELATQQSQLDDAIAGYLAKQIFNGFNAETFLEYGVNMAQCTAIGVLLVDAARNGGGAELENIKCYAFGSPEPLIAYSVNGDDVGHVLFMNALADWLDAYFRRVFDIADDVLVGEDARHEADAQRAN